MLKYIGIRFVRFIVRIVENTTDSLVVYMLGRKRSFNWKIMGMVILAIFTSILGFIPIQSALKEREPQGDPQYIVEFRKNLPASSRVIDGRIEYTCTGRETSKYLARIFYSYSLIYQPPRLIQEMESSNAQSFVSGRCLKDHVVVIPQPLLEPIVNYPLRMSAETPVKAVYMRGENTVPGRLSSEIERLKAVGGNAVVFDVKDVIGVVNFRTSVPIVEEYRKYEPPIADISKTIAYLHSKGIYTIARMALFQDQLLATRRPDLAIRDGNSPTGVLLVKGHPLWVDPGLEEVRSYNLQIVMNLVLLGVDEIQFDYVRYPAEGNLSKVTYHNVKTNTEKTEHLREFLSAAHFLTEGTGIRTAIDIFGVVAWGEEVDVKTTGQRIEMLAPHVDVVSPMLYPSHFNAGFDGFARPADEGFHFYSDGVRRLLEKAGTHPIVRPWVQAFKWRVSLYNEHYILEQIKGIDHGGGRGWLMWNAGNDYDMVYRALSPSRRPEAPRQDTGKTTSTVTRAGL